MFSFNLKSENRKPYEKKKKKTEQKQISNSMHFPIQSFPRCIITFLFIFILSLSISPSSADPRTSIAGLFCGSSNLSDLNRDRNNAIFKRLMKNLKSSIIQEKWGLASDPPPSPYPALNIFGQCHKDLSHSDCATCFYAARDKITNCLPASSAQIYLDGCYIAYDYYINILYGYRINSENNKLKCSPPSGVLTDKLMKSEFAKKVSKVVQNVTQAAPKNEGFAFAELKGGVTSVYALAQCWLNLVEDGCSECLNNATRVKNCLPGGEGIVMNPGCFLTYSNNNSYGTTAESMKGDHETNSITIAIACVLGAVAIFMLLLFGAFLGYKKLSKKRGGYVSASINKSNLSFKYEMLEKATDFFNASMKLGQGGAGSVFKGTLSDGQIVAVKRLFYSTRQWVDEFFNEVNLISGIEHKNLVKLLGCSIEGPESLLVYEYVPNGSLDQLIFDKKKTQIVSWKKRISIIYGTADGLAYLHGCYDSPLKIIHRDIKGSNILLDKNLTPKIADFGLARCVAGDKSHISTGIAGTLGYMAPEYLVRGQLTEKADVYAFGVLVLEIVSGRKNSVFTGGSSSILQTAWRHYKSKKLHETVDPSLKGNFPAKEASNVLQIGLLCTQASAALRPSMFEVVQMLNDEEIAVPAPKQPPFLNSSILGTDSNTTKSFTSISGLSLSEATISELSSTYTTTEVGPETHGQTTAEESSSHTTPPSAAAACPEPNSVSETETRVPEVNSFHKL